MKSKLFPHLVGDQVGEQFDFIRAMVSSLNVQESHRIPPTPKLAKLPDAPHAPRCSQMLPDAHRCCQMLPDAATIVWLLRRRYSPK
jgi:hypothetical protein